MKKVILATLVASVSTLAVANTTGVYVQADVLPSRIEAKFDGEKAKDSTTGFRISAGKKINDIRGVVDYTHFGKLEEKETSANGDYAYSKLTIQSIGASALYDFNTQSGFTPYVGAKVAVNQARATWNDRDTVHLQEANGVVVDKKVEYDSGSEKKTKVGVGVLAGVQYQVNPQFAVDAGVEYNHLGKFSDTKVNQYGAKVGVRYSF